MDYVLASSGPDGLPDLFTIYDAARRYGSCGPADTRVLAVGTRGGGASVVTPTGNAAETSRRALLKISEATILTTVDGLDLRGHAKISAVVGIPLRNLQQRHDVSTFAATAPIAAVTALLELLAMVPLEKVIAALGDHADTPNFEQLSEAIDVIVGDGASSDDVIAVLAFAIAEEFPAAPHCRRLLEEHAEWALPELPEIVVVPTTLNPKQTDPAIKEQRRRRREEEKKRKRGPTSTASACARPRPSRRRRSVRPPPNLGSSRTMDASSTSHLHAGRTRTIRSRARPGRHRRHRRGALRRHRSVDTGTEVQVATGPRRRRERERPASPSDLLQ